VQRTLRKPQRDCIRKTDMTRVEGENTRVQT
jgi:hypothetical protein